MEYQVFTIFDKAVKAFNIPFFAVSEMEAVRNFKMLAQDPTTTIYKNPEDFILFEVDTFDTQSGEFCGGGSPRKVASALDFPVHSKDQVEIPFDQNLKVGGTE